MRVLSAMLLYVSLAAGCSDGGGERADATGIGIESPCTRYRLPCDGDDWPPNVLLIIADDVGIETVRSYGARPNPARTANLDRLAREGVTFENAYAFPWCSPTRAGILTGRLPRAFAIGRAIRVQNPSDVSLPQSAETIPEVLDAASPWTWSHAIAGKWHLTTLAAGARDAAERHGFQQHRGAVGNLYAHHAYDGNAQDYYDWERVVDGVVAQPTPTRPPPTSTTLWL